MGEDMVDHLFRRRLNDAKLLPIVTHYMGLVDGLEVMANKDWVSDRNLLIPRRRCARGGTGSARYLATRPPARN